MIQRFEDFVSLINTAYKGLQKIKSYEVEELGLKGNHVMCLFYLGQNEGGLTSGFAYALTKMGINYGDKKNLRRFIGPPLKAEFRKVYSLTDREAEECVRLFREYFSVYGWWDNKVYPGIVEMLAALRAAGKKLILATSKPEDTAKKIMSLFELDKYFDFIGGAAGDNRDHKWQVLEYSMSSAGADPSRTILVGDRIYDADGAAKCGVDSLGVLWGHGSPEEIAESGFTMTARTPEDVVRLLK